MFTACGITHRRGCRLVTGRIDGALYHKQQTQSTAPEDGRNYGPKHVELIGIINTPLLLHLVGSLYYCINDTRSYKHQIHFTVLLSLVYGNSIHEVAKEKEGER